MTNVKHNLHCHNNKINYSGVPVHHVPYAIMTVSLSLSYNYLHIGLVTINFILIFNFCKIND